MDRLSLAVTLAAIQAALDDSGLIVRGGFSFGGDEPAPACRSGLPARSVVLVGNAGASFWPTFSKWRQGQPDRLPNPLDTWSRRVLGHVAAAFSATAISPSDKPYYPFQQWAMRAEGLRPSPLGMLMHPDYGLWHAYRGALLFDCELAFCNPKPSSHLCDACTDRPCLRACPVGAHTEEGFAHGQCLEHVRSSRGVACMQGGCLDRNACPFGRSFVYPADMQAFIMRAFAA